MIMSEEIIKVLDYITEKLGVAIDWTTENALPYVEEVISKYITYKVVCNAGGLLMGVMLLIIGYIVFKNMIDSRKNCVETEIDNFWWEDTYHGCDITINGVFGIAGLIIDIVAGVVITIVGVGCLMKWSIIPEIALLEEIKYLVG